MHPVVVFLFLMHVQSILNTLTGFPSKVHFHICKDEKHYNGIRLIIIFIEISSMQQCKFCTNLHYSCSNLKYAVIYIHLHYSYSNENCSLFHCWTKLVLPVQYCWQYSNLHYTKSNCKLLYIYFSYALTCNYLHYSYSNESCSLRTHLLT